MLSSLAFATAPSMMRLASSSVRAIAVASVPVVRVVVGIAQHPTGQRAAVLAVFQQNLAVDDRHVDALRRFADAHGAGREVVYDLVRQRTHRVGIENYDVR